MLAFYTLEAALSHRGGCGAIFLPPSASDHRSLGATLRWYGLSVALSAAALALMVLLRPLMEHSIFFLFLAAVAISALYGGLGPGLVATVLSTVACAFFFIPPDNVPFGGPEEVLRLTIFLLTGVMVSWLTEGHKRSKDQLRQRTEDLERWVAQRKALEEQLERRASHDYLTDLHNQASFYEHLSHALSCARRQGGKVALLFIDLDNFKLVNDSLGHQEGDRVLRMVAQRLKGCLQDSEMAARIGGDEFVVVLEDVADASTAVRVAERFQERLRVPFDVGDGPGMYTSASIGIAFGAREGPQELVYAADLAAYQAKGMGKGCSVVFDSEAIGGPPT
jgi:diguanylate cyclase (GGDEF)-like protein